MRYMQHTTLAFLVAVIAACGSSGGSTAPPPPPGNGRTIDATASLTFTPTSLTVNAGDTVVFAFGSVAHNVFFSAQTGAPQNIGGSNANVSVSRIFTTAGTYHYACGIHPFMQGTVVVR